MWVEFLIWGWQCFGKKRPQSSQRILRRNFPRIFRPCFSKVSGPHPPKIIHPPKCTPKLYVGIPLQISDFFEPKIYFRRCSAYAKHRNGVVLIRGCFQNFHLVVFVGSVAPRNIALDCIKKGVVFRFSSHGFRGSRGFECEHNNPLPRHPLPALRLINECLDPGALSRQRSCY